MTYAKIYDVGDKVLLELTVAKKEFDDRGNIKYQLKDERSKKLLGWSYFDNDLIPCEKKTTSRTKAPATKKSAVATNKGEAVKKKPAATVKKK